MEARAGIEPACKDLQSSASPLRHRASRGSDLATGGKACALAAGGGLCNRLLNGMLPFAE